MGRIRASLLLLVSLVFVGTGGWMLVVGAAGDRPLAAACLAFFGACAIVFVGELLPKHAPTPDAAGVTIITPDRTQMAMLVLACGLAAGACPGIAALAAADGQIVKSWITWSGTALFGAGVPISLWRMIRAKPLYRLDAHGIENLSGKGWTIPWTAIRNIETFGQSGQNWLALEVDPAIGIQGGAMQTVNRAFGFPAFTIGAQGTGMRFAQLADLVLGYWTRGRGW